jgi:ATP-dependent DNA helicase DinG
MLDAAAPTRLFSGLPAGVQIQRVSLVEAIEAVEGFLGQDAPPQGELSRSD